MKFNRANGLVYSMGLHLLVACILYFGVPSFSHPLPEDHVIVVDVVNVSELTNIASKPRPKKPETPKPQQPIKEKTSAPEAPKPEAKPEFIPEAKPVPTPESPKVKIKKEEKPAKEKPKDVPVKKEQPKKDEKKKKKKPDPFSDDFLKTLEESAQKHRPNDDLQEVLQDLETDSNKPYNSDIPMSLSEVDAIRSQVQKAWNTSSFNGADAQGMQVWVKITLDSSGNVLQAQPVLEHNSSPQYQAFVDSAVRAVRIASPIQNLPPEKVGSWGSIEFRFDSSGLIY